MQKLITVIDLGSSKIAAATAALERDGEVSLLGLDSVNSRGIKRGDIVDLNKVVEDISSIVKKLERVQERKIKKVFVTGRGIDVKIDASRGMVPLSKVPREITKRDVAKCLDIAAMIRLPLDRVVLQKFVRSFHIDGGALNVRNPVGLYGIKLEAETFIATASQSKVHNITKCVDHAGLLLEGIHLSGVACADSVLEDEERNAGVLLLDIGDSLTEELVFRENALKGFSIIKKGAQNILNNETGVDKYELGKLLKEARNAIKSENEDFSSVVVTGGGALLDGVIEETEKLFNIPARIGIVKKAGRDLNSQEAIVHTSTIGLINRIAKDRKATHPATNPFNKTVRKFLEIYESYF